MLRTSFRSFTALLAFTVIVASCSSSKNAVSVPAREDIKGNWTLDKVGLEGISAGEKVKLNLLDEGPEACLEGSSWVLPNNGYGSYTINSSAGGCVGGQKDIIWSYKKESGVGVFQFKKLIGGVPAKDVADGYRFTILSATGSTFTLQSEVTYAGSPIKIIYNFSKK